MAVGAEASEINLARVADDAGRFADSSSGFARLPWLAAVTTWVARCQLRTTIYRFSKYAKRCPELLGMPPQTNHSMLTLMEVLGCPSMARDLSLALPLSAGRRDWR
jgi:hypothetical protein